MAMRFKTATEITRLVNELGHEEFTADRINGVTFATFKKYVAIERIERQEPTNISFKDYVAYMMGAEPDEDFWGYFRHYKPNDKGEVVRIVVTYKIA